MMVFMGTFLLSAMECRLAKNRINRDITLLKKLEANQKILESKARKSQNKKFKAHPNLIHSGSDTTTTCTPRVLPRFSASSSSIACKKSERNVQETKQRAQDFHRMLHEKLSIIDSTPLARSDFTGKGDSVMGSCKTSIRSASSIGGSSLESEVDFSISHRKNKRVINGTDCSVASKVPISGPDKRSTDSRLSSQPNGSNKRGIPGSVFEAKFKVIVTKSLQSIAAIKALLEKGIEPPDGEEDESRRLIKVKEFSNRFSRNYLYPLARHLNDLHSINQLNPLLVNQKLLSTYHLHQNALQAYQTHLPTSFENSNYNQLKILMSNIVQVCNIHRNQLKTPEEDYVVEYIDTFKVNAELMIQKIEEYLATPCPLENALKSDPTSTSLVNNYEGKQKNSGTKVLSKKNKLDSRLSMYTMTASFRKDAPWKKAVQNLAKKKFNVNSKYKTATYKHRPPLQRNPEIISLPKFKAIFPARAKTTRLNSPINEDCIRTMVEADRSRESHLEKEEWENMEKKTDESKQEVNSSNKEEILMKLLQFTLKNHHQGPVNDDQTHVSEILKLIKNEPDDEFLKKILDGLTDKRKNEDKQQVTLEIVRSQSSLSDCGVNSKEKTKRKEPKITITGEKNARLICITDDNSIIDPPEDEQVPESKIDQPEIQEVRRITFQASSETQTDLEEPKVKPPKPVHKHKQFANIKISRLKKSERSLKPIDKKLAVAAIQYKLDFYRYCKSNPMYKRSTTCQPWILMGKISEELLNLCLLDVAREIEINDIVEKVYQSELQL